MNSNTDRIEDLYREHRAEYVKTMSMAGDEAEDVVQEAFTRALVYEHTWFPDKGTIEMWMYRILMNAFADWRRDKLELVLEDKRMDVVDDLYDRNLEQEEILQVFLEEINAIDNLEHRDILYLRFVEGMPTKTIAAIVQCADTKVRKAIHDFKKRSRSNRK